MAKFQKGQNRPDGAGRKAGVPNKSTAECKEAITDLISGNIPKLQMWLDKVAEDDPAKAFDLLIKMMEFSVPKLSRIESKDKDAAETPTKIIIQHIGSKIIR